MQLTTIIQCLLRLWAALVPFHAWCSIRVFVATSAVLPHSLHSNRSPGPSSHYQITDSMRCLLHLAG